VREKGKRIFCVSQGGGAKGAAMEGEKCHRKENSLASGSGKELGNKIEDEPPTKRGGGPSLRLACNRIPTA